MTSFDSSKWINIDALNLLLYRFSAVYAIKNKFNDKVYIGSTKNVHERLREHIYDFKTNTHKNKHLSFDYNLNNDCYEYFIIEKCPVSKLLKREQFYMDKYLSYKRDFGYNICPKSDFTARGEETNEYFSNLFKGENNPFYNKKHTIENREKASKFWSKRLIGSNNPNYGKGRNRGKHKHSEHAKKTIKESLICPKYTSIKVEKDGVVIYYATSISDLHTKFPEITKSNACAVLAGRRMTVMGYKLTNISNK